jgi:hypothetical protein
MAGHQHESSHLKHLTVGHSIRNGQVVNTLEALGLGNKEDQFGKFDYLDLGLMHHNVQSLNNKLLDTTMMLTVDNLNINVLFY